MERFYIIIILLFISCGSRKTAITKTNIKSDSLIVENSRIINQNIVLNDIGQIHAFDSSKPMIIDGKEYFNASIIYDKSQFNNFELQEGSKIIQIKKDSNTKHKETEKSDNTILYIGIAFIIGLWFYFKKDNLFF